MNDHTPAKLLLCARDVVAGIILPWSVSSTQQTAIRELIAMLDDAAAHDPYPAGVVSRLEVAVAGASTFAAETMGVRGVHERLDRARLTIEQLLEAARHL